MNLDVLIIGSGGAGLSAALSAKENTKKVLVLSKTFPTHSQTCQAQGGINAVLDTTKDDSIESFVEDTYKSSHKLGNLKNIELFCNEAKKSIKWLDEIAVPFSRNEENSIAQRKFGGTKAKRTCYSSDYTGLKILHTLYDQAIKANIEFLNEHLLLNLIVEENSVKGVTTLDITSGEIKEVYANSVILASGGYAGLYQNYTTNSYASTGDGIAAAFKAGAKLSNMEFVQFHPTSLLNKNILISESARGEGGYLVDEEENRFIDELKPRDEVSRAIYEKTSHGSKVYLDLRHLGEEKINEAMPQERRLVQEFMGLDMCKDLIPINPSAHYTMGGILTEHEGKTTLENLYACGECAQSGIHGANRLGGNSLQEIITLGRRVGKKASKELKTIDKEARTSKQYKEDKEMIEKLFKEEKSSNFYKAKDELGKILFKKAGLFREEETLNQALKFVNTLKEENFCIDDKSRIYNKNLVELLEFKNSILLSEIILKSAILRKESRGAHYRIDFKEELESFDKNSTCKLENEKIQITFEEVS